MTVSDSPLFYRHVLFRVADGPAGALVASQMLRKRSAGVLLSPFPAGKFADYRQCPREPGPEAETVRIGRRKRYNWDQRVLMRRRCQEFCVNGFRLVDGFRLHWLHLSGG
jgi:hypothetical protein